METSDSFNHLGVAVFHSSVREADREAQLVSGRHCCFTGHLSSPTWTAVGRAFEVRPTSPQGVEIGYCCTFSTAEQDECLEHSMGKHSMCQVWSCMNYVVSAEQLFKKVQWKFRREGN